MKKTLLSFLVAILIAVTCCGCLPFLDREESEKETKKEKSNLNSYDENNVDVPLYDVLLEGVLEYEKKIEFNYDCTEELFDTYAKVLADHPEIFWATRGSKYSIAEDGDELTVTFSPEYFMSKAEIEAGKKAIEDIKTDILNGVNPNSTDYEKVLYIHDYIINNTVYDTKSAEENDGSGKKLSDNVYKSACIYGCFVEKKAICTGYSAAFQFLMNELGMESGRVSGSSMDGSTVGHQWNYVKVDGEYYYIDLTWDDPVSEDGSDSITYTYFLVDEQELKLTHIFDENAPELDCNNKRYNYFVQNGLYMEKYSFDGISSIISRSFADGEVEIKFSSPEELKKATRQLFDNKGIWNIYAIKKLKLKTIYHAVSKNGLILRISATE